MNPDKRTALWRTGAIARHIGFPAFYRVVNVELRDGSWQACLIRLERTYDDHGDPVPSKEFWTANLANYEVIEEGAYAQRSY